VREIEEEEISEEIAIVIKIAARCLAVHIPCFSSQCVMCTLATLARVSGVFIFNVPNWTRRLRRYVAFHFLIFSDIHDSCKCRGFSYKRSIVSILADEASILIISTFLPEITNLRRSATSSELSAP